MPKHNVEERWVIWDDGLRRGHNLERILTWRQQCFPGIIFEVIESAFWGQDYFSIRARKELAQDLQSIAKSLTNSSG